MKDLSLLSKKKFIVLLFFSLFFKNGFAQTPYPFPDDSAFWRVDYWEAPPFQCTGFTATIASYQYTYNGDTLINGFNYKKILKSGNIFFPSCYPGSPLGYQGAIRDDSIAKMVYLVLPGNSTDTVLYDYNLSIGDTVRSYLKQLTPLIEYIVTAIDSQMIGGDYRKKWILTPSCPSCLNAYYIEGVGNLYGLLDSYYQNESGSLLLCFSVNSQPLYYDAGNPNSCTIVKVGYQDKFSNALLSPNPVCCHSFKLTNLPINNNIERISITDITGRKHDLIWKYEIPTEIIANYENLTDGIYSVDIITMEGQKSNKLLIIATR